MAIQFVDGVRVSTVTTGTGTIKLGAAVPGFQTFDAAVAAGALTSGATVYYTIEDTGNVWEVGSGVYTFGAETLTRVVSASSLGGTLALALSGAAQVYLTLTAPGMAAYDTAQVTAILASGNLTLGANTGSGANLSLNAATPALVQSRAILLQTAGVNRWAVYANGDSETGLNTGSDFAINAYNDAGTFLFSPVSITRSTGLVSINNGLTLSGSATSSTPALNTNTTQIATTAFVRGQLSSSAPAMNGTASAGISNTIARSDHVHPSDTSRQAALGFTPVQQDGGIGQGTNKIYLGWSTSGTGAKITVDATDVGLLGSTIYPQSFVANGASATFSGVTVSSGANGSIGLSTGATNTGYAGFFNAAATRMGYAGYGAASGYLNLQSESTTAAWATNLAFTVGTQLTVGQNMVCGGYVAAGSTIYVGGSANAFYLNLTGGSCVMSYTPSPNQYYHIWNGATGQYSYVNPTGTLLYYVTGGGNLVIYGNLYDANVSDERTKENVQPYDRGLADLIQLNPVSFAYNVLGGTTDDGTVLYGLTAQQAQPHVPECVSFTTEPPTDDIDGKSPSDPIRLSGQLSFDEKPLIFASLNAFKEIDARLRHIEDALGLLPWTSILT